MYLKTWQITWPSTHVWTRVIKWPTGIPYFISKHQTKIFFVNNKIITENPLRLFKMGKKACIFSQILTLIWCQQFTDLCNVFRSLILTNLLRWPSHDPCVEGPQDHRQVQWFPRRTQGTQNSCSTHSHSLLQQNDTDYSQQSQELVGQSSGETRPKTPGLLPVELKEQHLIFPSNGVWHHQGSSPEPWSAGFLPRIHHVGMEHSCHWPQVLRSPEHSLAEGPRHELHG